MQYTTNYNLKKPEDNDVTSNEDFNENFDVVDEELKRIAEDAESKLSTEDFENHKHKTSDITDFPDSLPADGGNADTVGGKGVTDFVQNYKQVASGISIIGWAESVADDHNIVTGRVWKPTDPPPGYVAGDCDFWCEVRSIGANKQYIQVKARDIRSNAEYLNTKMGSTWQGWVRVNDGGNAAKLDSKTSDMFAQYTSGNELHVKRLGGENGARVSLQRGTTESTLQGDVKVDIYKDFFRVWTEMNSQAKGFNINLQDIPNGTFKNLAVYTSGTTDITAGSTNIGKGMFHIVYE